MFRKNVFMLAACLCFFAAPVLMAEEYRPYSQSTAGIPQTAKSYADSGSCYRGLNGTDGAISWVKSESQCRNQSNGQSWVSHGVAQNYHHKGK